MTITGYPNRVKSRANITDQSGTVYEKAGYKVMGRTAILRVGGRQVLARNDVVHFERVPPFRAESGGSAYNWRLSFDNGEAWTITELAGGCGCGGGR